MPFEAEMRVALEAAARAGKMIRREYETFVAIPDAPISITTEVDRLSQEIILQTIQEAFPADRLCAEENTPTLKTSPREGARIWIVDPIDGTRGFAMKNGEFSVMIGLAVDGEAVVGVVLEPAHERLTYAAKGAGCWTTTGDEKPRRCRVSECRSLRECTLIQSHYKPTTPNLPRDLIRPAKQIHTYSAGVKLAYVARGDADIYVNDYPNFHDWDICAGHFLVIEAGGMVTGLHGKPILYGLPGYTQDDGLLATNGILHAEAGEKVRVLKLN
jgi:3'(2'), 5'-bisphosphate nucleotidase